MAVRELEIEDYRPVSWRRRVLIALLAVATATTVILTLVGPPGAAKTRRADAPLCTAGRTTDCVGGTAQVIVPAASAAR